MALLAEIPSMMAFSLILVTYLIVLGAAVLISVRPFRIPIYLSGTGVGLNQTNMECTSEDGIPLRGWFLDPAEPPERSPDTAFLFIHGYMMNRAEWIPEARLVATFGCPSLVFDCRAHGLSGGRWASVGWRERHDVRAAARALADRYPTARIVAVGSSMGAAAAVFAAADEPDRFGGLILDSSYGRMSYAILGWWSYLGRGVGRFLLAPTVILAPLVGINPFRIDVAHSLKKVPAVPILFLHGDRDPVAFPGEANRNFAAAPGDQAEIVWFAGCGHSEGRWLQTEAHHAALVEFLTRYSFVTAPQPDRANRIRKQSE